METVHLSIVNGFINQLLGDSSTLYQMQSKSRIHNKSPPPSNMVATISKLSGHGIEIHRTRMGNRAFCLIMLLHQLSVIERVLMLTETGQWKTIHQHTSFLQWLVDSTADHFVLERMQLGPIVTIPKAGQSTCKPLRTILTIGGSHYLFCCYQLIFCSSVLSIYCIFCLWRWCSKSCNSLCKDFHSVMSGVSASGLLAFETVCRISSSSSCLVVPRAFWWTTFSSWSSFLLWGCATDAKSEPW